MISVITPCYNASAFIEETINSVLSQTYTDWEMIIVDDCSSDNSAEIIRSYFDSRIKYFKTDKPSGSPAKPRNIGIQNAQGEYIAFLDSDDLWLPNKLESQIRFMKIRNVDFVYSYYSRFSTLGKIGGVIKSPDFANYDSIKKRDYIPMLTILLKKRILNGIQFEDRPKEDFVFLLNLFKNGVVGYNTRESVALYRIGQSSRSSNKFDMFKKHYFILRDEGFTIITSFLYTMTHCLAAVLKYSK